MTRFVKIADEANESLGFINLDLVTRVQCSVEKRGGSSFDIAKMETVSTPKHLVAVVTLSTANGIGKVVFKDVGEAETWLQKEFGIAVSFQQIA